MNWLIIAAVGTGAGLALWLGGRLRALLQLRSFGRAVVAADPDASFHFTRYGLIEPWLVLQWSVPAKRQISLTFIPSLLSASCFWTCVSLVELRSDIDRLNIYPPGWYYSGWGGVRVRLDIAGAGSRPDLEAYRSTADDPARITELLGHPAMARALEQLPPAVKLEIRTPGGGGAQTQIRMYDGHFPPSRDRLAVWLGALDQLCDALEQALRSRPYR